MEAFEPKRVNSILNIIVVNLLILGGLQITSINISHKCTTNFYLQTSPTQMPKGTQYDQCRKARIYIHRLDEHKRV